MLAEIARQPDGLDPLVAGCQFTDDHVAASGAPIPHQQHLADAEAAPGLGALHLDVWSEFGDQGRQGVFASVDRNDHTHVQWRGLSILDPLAHAASLGEAPVSEPDLRALTPI